MLHTKFRGNRPTDSREEDFDGFIPYVTSIMSSDFHYLKAFIQSLVQIATAVPGKIQFEFLHVYDLRPRSRFQGTNCNSF